MTKEIRLFDYMDRPKTIVVDDFEKVKLAIFEIKSGDGILTLVYDDHKKTYDSCDVERIHNFDDGTWLIMPKDIDVLNKMKDHYDTDLLYEVEL
jgi:hypothetical protein